LHCGKTPTIPRIFALRAGNPAMGKVDIPDSIWYIRRLEVEDMAFVGPQLYPNSNPIN
jgi:hypothetical protein